MAREGRCVHASHKVREPFPRNPYSVNNVMDVWECDLVDVQALRKFNDNFKYLLSVIDIFSKFLHMKSLKSKTGTAVTAAFESVFGDSKYSRRRPIWVRTDKGKEFLNRNFQDMLKRKGIQFQVCKNPDVKCSVVERVHRTIRNRIDKYFRIKTPTDISTFCRNLSGPTTPRFTLPRPWHRRK